MLFRNLVLPGILLIAAGAVPVAFLVSGSPPATQQTSLPIYQVQVVAKYKHDPKAFCQGLVVSGNELLEGTGQERESTLRRVDLKTGKVLAKVDLPPEVFGEGITVLNKKVYQLTWKKEAGYIYDARTLHYEKFFRYTGEGWGLTTDGRYLIMSDGTATLRYLDPTKIDPKTNRMKVVRRVKVLRDGNRSVRDLNELEYVNGEIFANIWHSGFVARINPKTGRVKSWLDLRPLRPAQVQSNEEAVWNGIAWDAKAKRLFVTGKDWPLLYEIKIKGDKLAGKDAVSR